MKKYSVILPLQCVISVVTLYNILVCSSDLLLGSLEQGTDFLCGDGKIIPMYKVCDGSFDCPDKTDEVSCGKTIN